MTTNDPARMIREAMEAKGLSKRRLGALVGVLKDGTIVDATGIRKIVEGRRRSYTSELVSRIVNVLEVDRLHEEELIDFDADDLYEATGVWPEGFTATSIRAARTSTRASGWKRQRPAQRLARIPRRSVSLRPLPMAA